MNLVYILNTDCLKDEALFSHCLKHMPKERRTAISRSRNPSDKRLSLGAGILQHMALKEFRIDAEKARIHKGPGGKPV